MSNFGGALIFDEIVTEKLYVTNMLFECVDLKINTQDIETTPTGEIIGYVDILYPVAGLRVNMRLEVYKAALLEDFIYPEEYPFEGRFKVPFAKDETALSKLYVAMEEIEIENMTYLVNEFVI